MSLQSAALFLLFALPPLLSGQAISGSAQISASLTVKGQKVDFSGAADLGASLIGQSGDELLSLLTAVPPSLQGDLPPELAAALKKETVKDLKAELGAVFKAIVEAKSPQELADQLAKLAPETVEVLKQIGILVKAKAKQLWDALSEEDKKTLKELFKGLKKAVKELAEKVKQKYQELDAASKQSLQAAVVAILGPIAQKVFDVPIVKVQIA